MATFVVAITMIGTNGCGGVGRGAGGTPEDACRAGHAETRSRYREGHVPYGEECVSQEQRRVCLDGAYGNWSGAFVHDDCIVAPAADCGHVAHGTVETRTRYETSTVPHGNECKAEEQTRTCNNGTLGDWTGTFDAEGCFVGCEDNDGRGPGAHGETQTRTRYEVATTPYDGACASEQQKRTCTDGVWSGWSGDYVHDSCRVPHCGDGIVDEGHEECDSMAHFCTLACTRVGAVAVAAGVSHACALLHTGAVDCWGDDRHGQLGNGDDGCEDAFDSDSDCFSASAVGVVDLDGRGSSGVVASIAAGGDHTCALLVTGAVVCWGWNEHGELGNGWDPVRVSPVLVAALDGSEPSKRAVALSAGSLHTCAVLETGAVRCWGSNHRGQLGSRHRLDTLFTEEANSAYEGIEPAKTAVALSAGGDHTCALAETGEVVCWGADDYGQVGNGTSCDSSWLCDSSPMEVLGLDGGQHSATAIGIAAGWQHTCAVMDTGAVKCWGWNVNGQLGDGTDSCASGSGRGCQAWSPVNVSDIDGSEADRTAIAVAAGGAARSSHTCALVETGAVVCWGDNEYGQLGTPEAGGRRASPVPVVDIDGTEGPRRAVAVAVGYRFSCAVLETGEVRCWGWDDRGQLGDG